MKRSDQLAEDQPMHRAWRFRSAIFLVSTLTGVASVVAGYTSASATAGQPPTAVEGPAAAAKIPPVLLTNHHRRMCRIGVGDAFPPLELVDAAGGEPLPILEREGRAATVIALFADPSPATITMLEDLGQRLAPQYAARRVAIKAIAVGPDRQQVADLLATTRFELPTFLDPTGEGFAQLGEEILPRVYVLDATGKVVWFDIEFSQATERELRDTLDILTR